MEVQVITTEPTAKQSTETFFPVSTLKLVLMSLSTFGLYQIYWLYQNWRIVKYRERRKISPPWRSVLGLFFLYPIFRRVKKQAAVAGFGMLPAGALFFGWLLLYLLSYAPDSLLTAISFSSVLLLVPVQRKANSINRLADPSFSKNDTFGKMNWVALLIGGPIFLLSVLGLIVQSVTT